MKIVGLDGLSDAQIRDDLANGARFVVYFYCVSILVLTFKQPSSVYFIRPGQSAAAKGWAFTLLSLVFGWWGFPWGPIYTVQALWVNSQGGRDVTLEVAAAISAAPVMAQVPPRAAAA